MGNGGAERVIMRLYNYLIKENHDVTIVSATKKGILSNIGNIDIHYLGSKYALLSAIKFKKYLKRKKPDIVLSTLSSAIIVAGITRLLTIKKSYVLVMRIANIVRFDQSNFFRILLESFALSICDGVIANSKATHKSIEKILPMKFQIKPTMIISNPVLDDNFELKLKQFKRIHRTEKQVIFIGRFTPQKQVRHAIRAFKIIKDRIENVSMLIIGDGCEKKEIIRFIHEQDLSGEVSIQHYCDDIPSLLMAADCLINTSKYEGFGNIFIEGLAYCDNLVCYRSPGGASELLRETSASLADQGDIEGLANLVIKKLLENKIRSKDIRFLSNFSESHVCAIYENYLIKIRESR